ncbi:Conserved_hypothetical protein [Hexamita inflata]|uniref:Uncharacterized protein n=1 Tax=Hexamita inflata TaxID=28002 RepID=A0ABP1ITA1_9EUKA
MMAWSYKNKLFSFSMFSELLQQTDYDVLLKHKNDYTIEFFFQNVVQSVYSETQSINRDSSLLAKQIQKLIKETNFGYAMFTLPIGISGFWSENGLKVIYNQNGISLKHFFFIIANLACELEAFKQGKQEPALKYR